MFICVIFTFDCPSLLGISLDRADVNSLPFFVYAFDIFLFGQISVMR